MEQTKISWVMIRNQGIKDLETRNQGIKGRETGNPEIRIREKKIRMIW